jgi:hypothetical protein
LTKTRAFGRPAASPTKTPLQSRSVSLPTRKSVRVSTFCGPVAVLKTKMSRPSPPVSVSSPRPAMIAVSLLLPMTGLARVEQAGVAGRETAGAQAFPGLRPDLVVIAARRQERRMPPVALHHLEPQHAGAEGDGAVVVGHLEMDMADTGGGGQDGHGGPFTRQRATLGPARAARQAHARTAAAQVAVPAAVRWGEKSAPGRARGTASGGGSDGPEVQAGETRNLGDGTGLTRFGRQTAMQHEATAMNQAHDAPGPSRGMQGSHHEMAFDAAGPQVERPAGGRM